MIADAHSLGLGVELEEACLKVALHSAAGIPAEQFLSVNLSPEAVVAGAWEEALTRNGRLLVVEITEHAHITSYPAVIAAVANHPQIKVAVDDAGAGFASLRHILELSPDYIKLDISIIQQAQANPRVRKALPKLVALIQSLQAEVIIEGIENEIQLNIAADSGANLLQGYLLGKPAPASAWRKFDSARQLKQVA